MKNGYVTMSYGARSWNQQGRVLTLADRQDADRVDFSLPRGGVITGRVIDEYGDPAVGVNVQPVKSPVPKLPLARSSWAVAEFVPNANPAVAHSAQKNSLIASRLGDMKVSLISQLAASLAAYRTRGAPSERRPQKKPPKPGR